MADKWILSRLTEVVLVVTQHLENYQFSAAGEVLRDFTWNEFADWYLEIAKIQRLTESQKESTDTILLCILRHLLIMWHPFMPFVTEEIWKNMPGVFSLLMIESWPVNLSFQDKEAERQFHLLRDIIVAIRNIRGEYKFSPSQKLHVALKVRDEKTEERIKEEKQMMERMARLEELLVEQGEKEVIPGTAYADCGPVGVYVAVLNKEKEQERLSKELEEVRQYLVVLDAKLANTEFVTKAPEKVVHDMKAKQTEAQSKLQAIEEQLAEL